MPRPSRETLAEYERLSDAVTAAAARGGDDSAAWTELKAFMRANKLGDEAGFDPDEPAAPPPPSESPSVIAQAMLEAAAAGDTEAVAALQRLARSQAAAG